MKYAIIYCEVIIISCFFSSFLPSTLLLKINFCTFALSALYFVTIDYKTVKMKMPKYFGLEKHFLI